MKTKTILIILILLIFSLTANAELIPHQTIVGDCYGHMGSGVECTGATDSTLYSDTDFPGYSRTNEGTISLTCTGPESGHFFSESITCDLNENSQYGSSCLNTITSSTVNGSSTRTIPSNLFGPRNSYFCGLDSITPKMLTTIRTCTGNTYTEQKDYSINIPYYYGNANYNYTGINTASIAYNSWHLELTDNQIEELDAIGTKANKLWPLLNPYSEFNLVFNAGDACTCDGPVAPNETLTVTSASPPPFEARMILKTEDENIIIYDWKDTEYYKSHFYINERGSLCRSKFFKAKFGDYPNLWTDDEYKLEKLLEEKNVTFEVRQKDVFVDTPGENRREYNTSITDCPGWYFSTSESEGFQSLLEKTRLFPRTVITHMGWTKNGNMTFPYKISCKDWEIENWTPNIREFNSLLKYFDSPTYMASRQVDRIEESSLRPITKSILTSMFRDTPTGRAIATGLIYTSYIVWTPITMGKDVDFLRTHGTNYPWFIELINFARNTRSNQVMTQEEKVESIYNKLIHAIKDNQEGDAGMYSLEQALLLEEGVCRHKALLLAAMLDEAGFEAYSVTSINSILQHAWTRVVIDGETYDLDPETYKIFVKLPAAPTPRYQMTRIRFSDNSAKTSTTALVENPQSEKQGLETNYYRGKYCSNLYFCLNTGSAPQTILTDDNQIFFNAFFNHETIVNANLVVKKLTQQESNLNLMQDLNLLYTITIYDQNKEIYGYFDENLAAYHTQIEIQDGNYLIIFTQNQPMNQQELESIFSDLTYEPETPPTNPPEIPEEYCGNNICSEQETYETCSHDCAIDQNSFTCDYNTIKQGDGCVTPNVCGNGITDVSNDEACDDGEESTTCTADCKIKTPYIGTISIVGNPRTAFIQATQQVANQIQHARENTQTLPGYILQIGTPTITITSYENGTTRLNYSFTLYQEYTCQENWTCQQWSLRCVDGVQTRTCTDAHQCNNPISTPDLNKTCELCIDTDAGQNYNLRGTTTGVINPYRRPSIIKKIDMCNDTNVLTEYFCTTDSQKTYLESIEYNCPTECFAGKCT